MPDDLILVGSLPIASRMAQNGRPLACRAALLDCCLHVPPLNAFKAVAWKTLGWRTATGEYLLANLSVRLGTSQLRPKMLPRRDKQLHFQRLALSIGAAAAPSAAVDDGKIVEIRTF